MRSFLGAPPAPKEAAKSKKDDPEKRFSADILRSIHALQDHWDYSFDDLGKVLDERSRRPADRQVLWRGRLLVLELKVEDGPTLPYSAFKRRGSWHQVETLCAVTRAGGYGVGLVKQGRRCWVLTSDLLALALEGRPGSWVLGPPLREVLRVPHPRGHEGLVWDLEGLILGMNFSQGGGL